MLETIGLYELITNNDEIFYVTKDGKYAIIGNVIEIATNRNLTAEKLEQISKTSWELLPLSDAILKKKGHGTDEIAVFSDPYCPHCKELAKQLDYLNDITIYQLAFPLKDQGKRMSVGCVRTLSRATTVTAP